MKKERPFIIPFKHGETQNIGQLIGSSMALTLAEIINSHDGLVVVITDDMQQTRRLQAEIQQFTTIPGVILPDWETLPYDSFSPSQDIVSNRLACLYHLTDQKKGALLLPINTLMQKFCPPTFLTRHVFMMNCGEQRRPETLRHQLENAGYRLVTKVMEHGEYAVRGAILDVFPMGSNEPYRIDFFDNETDSIRTFDIDSQRTIKEINAISLLPAHEFPFDKVSIDLFRSQCRQYFDVRREPESIYQQVTHHILPPGIEYWQPFFFNEPLVPLFSYLPGHTLIITTAYINTAANKYWLDIMQRYESRRHDPLRPLLPPSSLWLPPQDLFAEIKAYPQIHLSVKKIKQKKYSVNLNVSALPSLTTDVKNKSPSEDLQQFCNDFVGDVIFSVESEGRREIVEEILSKMAIQPKRLTSLNERQGVPRTYIMIGSLEKGFIDHDQGIAFISENELMGPRIMTHQRGTQRVINTDNLIRSLSELSPGKPIVHLDHGVGRYQGLTILENGGIQNEYLVLLYANDTRLYVPVASLNLISRYSGSDEENAPLHKLGTDTWHKARQKAAEKIQDVAAELLNIYAAREARPGFKFAEVEPEYTTFCENFPYEITPDQKTAIGATQADMHSAIAMDRLICGDVGFGKTEVAMRAAFIAAMNYKQVAVLVPTTLLAQQHYENFIDRFAGWPLRIELLSRFKTIKEQQNILQTITEGKTNIVIGTHKLLQNDVKWHDLRLLIVDEEHRFGVKQKERIKAMRSNIDILTLTATPIPRTLNIAMNAIRDLSIIATPPPRRLAVKTFVREIDDLVIREAILREILRGGQVYYLHNDVRSIKKIQEKIQKLVPEAHVATAHGQMHERDLERVMNEFQHQKFNVLICTTIIETGIDIPNANTIIIERADKFGLAQLHQLRGRVGRSHHQAYAYLLTPHIKLLTADAKKRLDAISSLEDLGAGFALATHDLEIRGAGELLGEEQSGQITTIGFTLYMELLEEAVAALKKGKIPTIASVLNQHPVEIDLRLPALIPDTYMADVNSRLSFYKRLSNAKTEQDLHELKVEMIDRYGLLPSALQNLFDITYMKQIAAQIGISRIEFNDKGGFIAFAENHLVPVDYLLNLIKENPNRYRLDPQNRIKIIGSCFSQKERLIIVTHLLTEFQKKSMITGQE